jgi:hypothetical protein
MNDRRTTDGRPICQSMIIVMWVHVFLSHWRDERPTNDRFFRVWLLWCDERPTNDRFFKIWFILMSCMNDWRPSIFQDMIYFDAMHERPTADRFFKIWFILMQCMNDRRPTDFSRYDLFWCNAWTTDGRPIFQDMIYFDAMHERPTNDWRPTDFSRYDLFWCNAWTTTVNFSNWWEINDY